MNSSSSFHSLLVTSMFAFVVNSVCHAQYGYTPDPQVAAAPTFGNSMAPPPAQAPMAAASGFGHARSGTFLQLEGTTFSVEDFTADLGSGVDLGKADTTYGFMGSIGHIGQAGLGLELSAGYYTMDFNGGVHSFNGLSADVNAKLTVVPVFVNARFSLGITDSISLEIGAGGGAAYAKAEGSASTSVGDFSATQSAWSAAYQGMVGLTFALGANADLTLHYRYMVFTTAQDLVAQSFGLGLRFRL